MRTTHRRHSPSSFPFRALVAALACVGAPGALAQVPPSSPFMVTNSNDSGTGSLRQAITDANTYCTASPNPQVVFNGAFTVAVSFPLPPITCNGLEVVGVSGFDMYGARITSRIYGGSLPYGGMPGACGLSTTVPIKVRTLEVDSFVYGGSSAGLCGTFIGVRDSIIHDNDTGIRFDGASYAGGTVLADRNYIYSNHIAGIEVGSGATGSTISNNYIGATFTGAPAGNAFYGVYASADVLVYNNVIAGSQVGVQANVGIDIQGNKIGTDPSGNGGTGWGNSGGIVVNGSGTTINGRNVISGNTVTGVAFQNVSAGTLSDNLVGTDASGMGAVANGVGVTLQCSDSVSISNNTISGNTGAGLEIDGSDAIVVSGNRIGVADNGSSALGNSGFGIHFGSCTPPSLRESPDPANTKVRAKVASSGVNITGDNRIAFNGLYGVALDSGTTGIEIGGNRIYSNGLKNIDLIHSPSAASTERPNDTGDTDAAPAPNNGQNFPVINSVIRSGGLTTVSYTLDSTPGTYRIDLFANPAPARAGTTPSGIGTVTISSGPVSGTITVPNVVEDNFAATATRTTGSPETSEFSVSVAVTPTPALTVTPTSVNFGTINVGSSSSPSTIKLKSTGAAPWVLSSLSKDSCTSGQVMCSASAFICSTNCTTGSPGYATNAECTVNATYAPTAAGTDTTSIAICDNTGTPQFITLTGSAVTPPPPPPPPPPSAVNIVPNQHDFGSLIVGRRSAAQRFDIVNPGTSAVTISPPATQVPFEIVSNNCGATLGPNAGCAVEVVFSPFQATPFTGALTVSTGTGVDLTPASMPRAKSVTTASAALFGKGIDVASIETPALIDFGAYTLGSAPIARSAIVNNNGNAVVTIDSIRTTGPFTVSHDCPFNFFPGTSCTLTVLFSTTTVGDAEGSVIIVSNAAGGMRVIALRGLAQRQPVPIVTVNPIAISFGNRIIGTQSVKQRVTIGNNGGSAATLGPFVTGGDFVLVPGGTCGTTLAPQETCFVDVAMLPNGFGAREGTLTFTSNAAGSPHRVDLLGTGCRTYFIGNNRTGTTGYYCSP